MIRYLRIAGEAFLDPRALCMSALHAKMHRTRNALSSWKPKDCASPLLPAMHREGCVDMDRPYLEVHSDAVREETRKLQRPMT